MSKKRTTSFSEQRKFHGCAAQWRYGDLKAPRISLDRTALNFGTGTHHGIAEYNKELQSGRTSTTKAGIMEAVERHLREVDGDPKRVEKIIRNVTDWEFERLQLYGAENMAPLFIEKRFDIYPFKGYIDVVYQTDKPKEVIVVDWKTGRYSPDDWSMIQLTVYIYFMEQMGYTVKQALIIFVEHGMRTLGIRQMEKTMQLANTFFKRISNPDYHYPKNRSWRCGWCEFQLLCQYEDSEPTPGVQSCIASEIMSMMLKPEEVLSRLR